MKKIEFKTQNNPRVKTKIKKIPTNSISKSNSNSKKKIKVLNLSSYHVYQLMIKDPLAVNTLLQNGETFLSTSLKNKDKLTAELLLTSPLLDLSFKDKNGNSYLHLAIKQKIENIIRILVEKKIDLNIINNNGMTPLDFARFFKLNQNIINFLIIKGAKENKKFKFEKKNKSTTPFNGKKISLTHGNSKINLNPIRVMKKNITNALNDKIEQKNNINNNIKKEILNKRARIDYNNFISNTLSTTSKHSRNTFNNLVLRKKRLEKNITSDINVFGYSIRKTTPKKNVNFHYWSPVNKSPRNSFYQNSNRSFFNTSNNNLKKPNNIKKRLLDKNINYCPQSIRKVFLRNENDKSKINNTAFVKNSNDIKLIKKHMISSKTNKNLNYYDISGYNKKGLNFNNKKKAERNFSSLWLVHQKINKINNNYDYSKTYFTTKILNNQNINQVDDQNTMKENIQNLSTTNNNINNIKNIKNNSNNRNIYSMNPYYGEKLFNTFSEKNNFDGISPHVTIININASHLNNLNNTANSSEINNNNKINMNNRYNNINNDNNKSNNYSNINSINTNTINYNNLSYNLMKNNNNSGYNDINCSSNCSIKKNMSVFIRHEKKNLPLFEFLSEINMQKYYNIMIMNGYDDIKLIIEQTKKGLLLEDKELKEGGILIPGDRTKILIKILEKSGILNFDIPKNTYHICKNQNIHMLINNDENVNRLYEWLNKIKMEKYLINFINAGYFSVELLFVQMKTKNPLTVDFLKNEIKIGILRDRIIIINKLNEDEKLFTESINKEVVSDQNKGTGCLII